MDTPDTVDYAILYRHRQPGFIFTAGSMGSPSPGMKGFVNARDQNSDEKWTSEFGNSGYPISCTDISIHQGQIIYVAGYTNEKLTGQEHSGDRDAFVMKFFIE
jgi:hypothetical protein